MMKKMYSIFIFSMGSMLQGMEQKEIVPLSSESETMSQPASVNILSIADFWSHFAPYLLYNWGPQVTTQTVKASSCVDKATFAVFKDSHLKDFLINLFQRYALSKTFKKEEVLDNLLPALFANAQEKALYADETVTIEAFVETLKSSAQSKDWTPARAQLEVIRKKPSLVLQLNNAYWDVNPNVRTTVVSYALLLNAPKKLIKSLINCGAPLTNFSPKVLPPILILAMKTTGTVAIDPTQILGEEVVSVISNQTADRTAVKELITLFCASGAQMQDAFCNTSGRDPLLKNMSALEWAIVSCDKDLLEHLLSQQKNIQQSKTFLLRPCLIAATKFVFDPMATSSKTDIQRLAEEECFKLLLQYSKNNVSELFDACSAVISGFQSIPRFKAGQEADLVAENIIKLLSLFINYGVEINHLMKKKTLLDQAQDEGWHKAVIDFLIEKGACKSSCEFTQEETKNQSFRNAYHDILLNKNITGQSIEQEDMRGFLKDAVELVKTGYMDLKQRSFFNSICILAVDLGASLEETLELLTLSETHNLFVGDSPSYGNISSVFHKIVAWLHDVKRADRKNVFNEVIKRESLRSLLVKLAERGIKDKPNNEGKTAAQKAYELGFEEIASLILDSVSKS